MRKEIYRSSITGRIVTKKYAKENPDTTQKETVCELEKELVSFYDWVKDTTPGIHYKSDYIVNEYLNNKKQ